MKFDSIVFKPEIRKKRKILKSQTFSRLDLTLNIKKITKLVNSSYQKRINNFKKTVQVARAYGGGAGVDMTSFPAFKFAEPVIEPINISQ